MFRRILTNKWAIAAVVLLTAAVGAYFWFQRAQSTAPEPIVKTDETDRKTERQTPKRKDPTAETPPPSTPVDSGAETEEKTSGNETAASFQTSSNPLFVDGVPEHLRCPEEWVDVYFEHFEGGVEEFKLEFLSRSDEILTDYNPRRPLTEVYPLYIESEKYYVAKSDPERAMFGQARGRLDWLYQNLLDYPEIFVLEFMIEYGDQMDLLKDSDHFSMMRAVSTGELPPHQNVHMLLDGRRIHARTGYRYAETLTKEFPDGSLKPALGTGFSQSDSDATIIEIEWFEDAEGNIRLTNMSEEELEEASGWDYRVNPYTEGIYILPPDATEQILEKNRSKFGYRR